MRLCQTSVPPHMAPLGRGQKSHSSPTQQGMQSAKKGKSKEKASFKQKASPARVCVPDREPLSEMLDEVFNPGEDIDEDDDEGEEEGEQHHQEPTSNDPWDAADSQQEDHEDDVGGSQHVALARRDPQVRKQSQSRSAIVALSPASATTTVPTSSSSSSDIVRCTICKASSNEKPWFEHLQGEPLGNLCEACGVCCETYIGKLSVHEVVMKFCARDPNIVSGVNEARARLPNAPKQSITAREVHSVTVSGARMEEDRAFVLESVWTAHMGLTPTAMGLKVIELKDIEDNKKQGVVLHIAGVPADLPWMRVTLYSKTETEMRVVLLSPEGQLRAGHAQCVYNNRVKERVRGRSAVLRTGPTGLQKTLTYAQALDKKREIEEERKQAEMQHAAMQDALDGAEDEDAIGRRKAAAAVPVVRSVLAGAHSLCNREIKKVGQQCQGICFRVTEWVGDRRQHVL